jgi:hypothetical protein
VWSYLLAERLQLALLGSEGDPQALVLSLFVEILKLVIVRFHHLVNRSQHGGEYGGCSG